MKMSQKIVWWDELPEDLHEEILSWLSLENLLRFSCISKKWNALVCSTKFITGLWAKQPQPKGRRPWLLIQNLADCRKPCAAYCFYTQTWKTFPSLSFIGENENSEIEAVYCYGSAVGLLLVKPTGSERYTLCNPLTRTSFQLPDLNSILQIVLIDIVNDGDGDNDYKVVAVGWDDNGGQTVEIYEPCERIWKIAGFLPEDRLANEGHIVFSKQDGFLYCEKQTQTGQGVIAFSVRDGTSFLVPFPDPGVQPARLAHFSDLFICQSRILLLSGILQQPQANRAVLGLQSVIFWELEKKNDGGSSWCWKEFARMPPSLLDEFYRFIGAYHLRYVVTITNINCLFHLVAVGNCVCIKSLDASRSTEVLVYNISENYWSWLPTGPMLAYGIHAAFTFEPRPDMNLELK